MTPLVERLRNWERVYPEDEDKPEGSLYIEAADALELLNTVKDKPAAPDWQRCLPKGVRK